jgi:hypothetical protein
VVTGLIGVAFIAASFWWSVRENRQEAAAGHEKHEVHV